MIRNTRSTELRQPRRNRPTVCHVLHSLDVGGGEILARALGLQLEREFRPVFALLDNLGEIGERLQELDYPVHVVGRKPGFDYSTATKLRKFFRQQRVDVIHAHQYAPLFYSALARLAVRSKPIVFTEHGRAFPDFRRPKRVLANRVLLRSTDRLVAVGNNVRQALIDHEGLPSRQVEVVYNGRDIGAYRRRPSKRNTLRQQLEIGDKCFAIIQVARLDRLKDHATALRTIQNIAASSINAKLILVGDGPERESLENMARQLRVSANVVFLGSRNDVPDLLQAADAFLLSSISEGIPLTLIEAMASELPCVATNVGGVPEVVVDGESGLLAAAGDHVALAKALVSVAGSPTHARRLAAGGKERVAQQFDEHRMYAGYREIYQDLTSKFAKANRA